jgi:hypothetical protein
MKVFIVDELKHQTHVRRVRASGGVASEILYIKLCGMRDIIKIPCGMADICRYFCKLLILGVFLSFVFI